MSKENLETIVGIDLGTTNSAIAYLKDGVPEMIEVDGQKTMPSCVGLDESGGILVGQPALNQIVVAPERTIVSIKRYMGEETRISMGEETYLPEELSAFILKKLKQSAEEKLKSPVKKAVITVPAYFDENQRRATQNAAELAGLEAVRILNEPTAAALAYNLQNDEDQTILVYDLGGGTFDVSIVRYKDGLVEVCASHGDTKLGGDDFDQILQQSIAGQWAGRDALDLDDPRVSRRLLVAAEAAKRTLSDHAFAVVKEDYLTEKDHLDIELSRAEFEESIDAMLSRTMDSIQEALRAAELTVSDLDQVILVGGSTRIPVIQTLIEEKLGQSPSRNVDPDLIVTLGAAVQAGIIAGAELKSILLDISAHTFSNLAYDGRVERLTCFPLIKRGTPLPVTRSEVFFTNHDGQENVEIEVYQGESSDQDENQKLGKFFVEGLSDAPAGNQIVIQFSLDLNGVLEVTALEKATGFQKVVTIDTRDVGAALDLSEARERVSALFGDEEEGASDDEIDEDKDDSHSEMTRAKNLKKRAEKLLEGDLDEEDVTEISSLLEKSKLAVKSSDYSTLNDLSDTLEDIIFYLEV